eukprot:gene5413-10834_t
MSYLDIDQILAEEERLPCEFLINAKGLGMLDTSLKAEDLPAHSKIDLPLWLSQVLAEKNMVEVEIPKHFGARMRDEIMAGPSAMRLKDFSNYFFEVGLKLCKIKKDGDLQRTLRVAFCGDRYKTLMVRSLSAGHDDYAEYSQQLTVTELALFTAGNKAVVDLAQWRSRQASILKEASILGKKRGALFEDSNSKRDKK